MTIALQNGLKIEIFNNEIIGIKIGNLTSPLLGGFDIGF